MKSNIIKVNTEKLQDWLKQHRLEWYYFLERVPGGTFFDDGPTTWEFMLSREDLVVWRYLEPHLSLVFPYFFFNFKSKEIKDKFLKENPDFPVSKTFYEENPLTLVVDGRVLRKILEYYFTMPIIKLKRKLKDYFGKDSSIFVIDGYGDLAYNWSPEDFFNEDCIVVKFKTKDDLVLCKLSKPNNLILK